MQDVLKPELNRYQLTEMIGEGLSSKVYRANRIDSRGHSTQTVALKLLKSLEHIHLLMNEFEALCRIRSPHCVSVLGWENFKGSSGLVLEFVEGVSLERLLLPGHDGAGQDLSVDVITEITRQVQLGLEHLRAHNLCHGDLSPGNILIDTDGVVKLVDFGLANWSASEDFGTPEFMAPERWRGDAPDSRSDLYALGLIRTRFCPDLDSQSLLRVSPDTREPLDLQANADAQAELAQLVQMAVALRATQPMELQTLITLQMAPTRPQTRWRCALGLMFVLALLCPTIPRGLGSSVERRLSMPATLEVRSRHWVRVTLNDRDLGYVPIRARAVYPGRYRLKWRSARASGSFDIAFMGGERKVLTEADFPMKAQ